MALFSGLRHRQAQKEARRSRQRRYPDDWVYEYVPGDGTSYDLGRDYTECAIVKFLHAQDADELCPYLCDLDWVAAEVMGYGFKRTKTLAWGCDRCDLRMTKDATTTAPWPPRFVERTCGRPPATTTQSTPTRQSPSRRSAWLFLVRRGGILAEQVSELLGLSPEERSHSASIAPARRTLSRGFPLASSSTSLSR